MRVAWHSVSLPPIARTRLTFGRGATTQQRWAALGAGKIGWLVGNGLGGGGDVAVSNASGNVPVSTGPRLVEGGSGTSQPGVTTKGRVGPDPCASVLRHGAI